MAKGVLHLNVEFSAVTDEEGKFGRLATLLGLADAAHALGMCTRLWLACTRRGEAELPQWLVEQILGERGPDALVEAELASWSAGRGDSKTRRLRIGGAAKHCLWMSSSDDQLKTKQRRKGGESRAKTSSRQLDGTFAPYPADHPAPSSSSEISSASEISEEDLPPARDLAVPAPKPTAPTPAPSVPAVSPPAPVREDIARTNESASRARTADPPFDPAVPMANGRLAEATWRRVSDAAIALAAELELPAPIPFPVIAPSTQRKGFVELRQRIREEGPLAPRVCDRVVENTVKLARTRRSVEWLSEKLFGENAWINARNGIDPSARSTAKGVATSAPSPSKPRRADPKPARIPRDQLAGPTEFAAARAVLFGARAGPTLADPNEEAEPDQETA